MSFAALQAAELVMPSSFTYTLFIAANDQLEHQSTPYFKQDHTKLKVRVQNVKLLSRLV